jgi:hypothetical protein
MGCSSRVRVISEEFMVNRLLAFALAASAIGGMSHGLLAQKKDDKLNDALKRELVRIADEVAAGQALPNDLKLEWLHDDFLKAENGKSYVAFTVSLDAAKGTSHTALYWRVTKVGAIAPLANPDVTFVPTKAGSTTLRASRSFIVPAGTYDVLVAAREPSESGRTSSAPKVSVLKRTVTVPDFWNGELTTSSIIVLQRIDTLPAPLSVDQQVERPYAMGTVELVPALDTRLPKKSELQTFFLIYNPKTDSANKPNVSVEYVFYAGTGSSMKVFAKTRPIDLNSQTLQRFDVAAGDQLQAGRIVPLASFPEGDYRLEIRITDKIANKSLTRDLSFTVTTS